MKILRNIAIALVAFFLIGIGLLVQAVYRFDLQQNPIARHINDGGGGRPWGTRVPMVPEPFPIKTARTEIEQRLRAAGFTRLPEGSIWLPLQADVQAGHEIYSREGNMLVCNIQLYVIVTFDNDDGLANASGTEYEHGCL